MVIRKYEKSEESTSKAEEKERPVIGRSQQATMHGDTDLF